MIIVRDEEEIYTEVTHPPIREGIYDSPFKGKSLYECYEMFRRMNRRNGVELNYWFFVVLDERSLRDGTAILAAWNTEQEEGIIHGRAKFKNVNSQIVCLSIGHQGFEDTLEPSHLEN